jgi:hypothetical protein
MVAFFIGSNVSASLYLTANLFQGRKNTQEGKRPTIHDGLVSHADLERAVGACLQGYINAEVSPQHSRRPGSLDRGDSIDASLDGDLCHSRGLDVEGHHKLRALNVNSAYQACGP